MNEHSNLLLANTQKRARLAPSVRLSTFVWATVFLLAGVLLAGGWFPRADGTSDGARIALAGFCLTIGALLIGIPLVTWIILNTSRPEDYEGTCPVGRVCPDCGAFTFYPKNACKSCKRDLTNVVTTGSKRESL